MGLILNIDTATENASLVLSQNGKVVELSKNPDIKDHAAWIHTAIQALIERSGRTLFDLDAVAVTAGPGSYTGLRVGMATAKGLCFALGIPLITENTLKVMSQAALPLVNELVSGNLSEKRILLLPMIDARRTEVFTAVYDLQLKEVIVPTALVLEEGSFSELAANNRVICFGSGSHKFNKLVKSKTFIFMDIQHDASALALISEQKFANVDFSDLAYAEPVYLKDFYTQIKK